MPEKQPGLSTAQRVWRALTAIILLVAFACVVWWVNKTGLLKSALLWIKSLGPWASIAFVALYVAAVIVCLPAIILTIGGGFIFGMAKGSFLVLLAATIAGNLTFIIARHFARDWVSRKLEGHPKFRAIDDAVAREGWKIVALIRLAPFPYSFTSYGFGLTRLPLWEYFLANFALVPTTLMYVYLGTIARDLTEKIATPPWMKWTIGVALVITVFYVTRFAKRALAQKV